MQASIYRLRNPEVLYYSEYRRIKFKHTCTINNPHGVFCPFPYILEFKKHKGTQNKITIMWFTCETNHECDLPVKQQRIEIINETSVVTFNKLYKGPNLISRISVMVFNATFNNISVISLRSHQGKKSINGGGGGSCSLLNIISD